MAWSSAPSHSLAPYPSIPFQALWTIPYSETHTHTPCSDTHGHPSETHTHTHRAGKGPLISLLLALEVRDPRPALAFVPLR